MTPDIYMISAFIIFTATSAGCFFGRMRGGPPDVPDLIEDMLFCSVLLFAMIILGVGWVPALIAYTLSIIGVRTGHGQYFPSVIGKYIKPEKLDFIVRWIFGSDPRCDWRYKDIHEYGVLTDMESDIRIYGPDRLYRRCITGLSITGGAITLAPFIALLFVNPVAALALLIAGALKGPVYHVMHKMKFYTEGGEYGTGGVIWLIASILIVAEMI